MNFLSPWADAARKAVVAIFCGRPGTSQDLADKVRDYSDQIERKRSENMRRNDRYRYWTSRSSVSNKDGTALVPAWQDERANMIAADIGLWGQGWRLMVKEDLE